MNVKLAAFFYSFFENVMLQNVTTHSVFIQRIDQLKWLVTNKNYNKSPSYQFHGLDPVNLLNVAQFSLQFVLKTTFL